MNKVFVERDLYRDRANELLGDLDSCLSFGDRAITAKDRVISHQSALVKIQNEIIEADSIQIVDLNKMVGNSSKQIKLLKVQRAGLVVVILVAVGKLLL